MAILDGQNILSDQQAITSDDVATENVIDTGQVTPNVKTKGLYMNAVVNVTLAGNSVVKAQFRIEDSADNITFATVLTGAVVSSVAGSVLMANSLPNTLRRYVRGWLTSLLTDGVTPADPTSGSISAYISHEVERI